MSVIAIFELDSKLEAREIRSRLDNNALPFDITELDEKQRENPDICQSKRLEVYVRVYQSTKEQSEILDELKNMAKELLELSDGVIYYYRSSHAQEREADEEMIEVTELDTVPPTLHEPYTKRYVISKVGRT